MPPPPPELMDELVEEVLLRLPPHEPACLVHAALVCKRWRRLVSDPGFRRRFREFHGRPPMLGFLCNLQSDYNVHDARFVPTAVSSPCSPRAADDHHHWRADDARHGRVLLSRDSWDHVELMVWDPMTGQRQELPAMPMPWPLYSWKAAILCASAATGTCDHLDCHRGPFLVVYIGAASEDTSTCIYSSDAAAWSKRVSINHPRDCGMNLVQSVLVGKALYFMFHQSNEAFKYDLELSQVVSVIKLPTYSNWRRLVLTTTEDGGLGYATVIDSKLNLWSWKADSEGDERWLQNRAIDLDRLLPANALLTSIPEVVGFADGIGVIFLRLDNSIFFAFDLKTNKANEVYNCADIYGIIPYMGFCTPATKECVAISQN